MADITDKLSDLSKKAVKLRDKDELAWHEVAGELETSVGKAMLAYEFGKVKPADRVTAKNDAELGRKIVQLRDKEGLSWGRISARTGQGEQRCRSLYEEATGTSTLGNRIGKGGRHPGSGNGKSPRRAGAAKKAPAKKTGAVKKTPGVKKATGARKTTGAAKKATGVKKVAKKSGTATGRTTTSGTKALVDMDFDEISERLEGRKIGVQVGGDESKIRTHNVKSVKKLDGDELSFIDAQTGNTHVVKVHSIKRASK